MKLWKDYKQVILNNCLGHEAENDGISYWRNRLFAETIIYLIPFSLIPLIPGFYWSLVSGLIGLAIFDVMAICAVIIIGFVPSVSITSKKILFTTVTFSIGIIMVYYLGLVGPGLIFLYAAVVFTVIIFPQSYAYWTAHINVIIVVAFAIALYAGWLHWPEDRTHSLGSWIAVTTNLLFLSYLAAALIPRIFNGLQKTIENQKRLELELSSKQKSLEITLRELQQKNAELEQFASVASHDLKEPLRTINTFMQLLEKKYENQLDEKAKKYIQLATSSSKHMTQLINDLLDYSQMENNQLIKELINTHQLLKEILEMQKATIEDKSAQFELGNLPDIVAARTPMKVVFQNLISNALKYHAKGTEPKIKISGSTFEDHYLFQVQDNGIGIEPEHYQKIFIIFQRLHHTNEYSGTGIGLALCKKIVEQHGGKIWVESEPGKGSTFSFTIMK
ncbi:MAG TPA: ATP-binding protein [Cyclobacteriaceae bacterium]|nr:ATP-binding protein [Cyclobacteriaceae bacterium]